MESDQQNVNIASDFTDGHVTIHILRIKVHCHGCSHTVRGQRSRNHVQGPGAMLQKMVTLGVQGTVQDNRKMLPDVALCVLSTRAY